MDSMAKMRVDSEISSEISSFATANVFVERGEACCDECNFKRSTTITFPELCDSIHHQRRSATQVQDLFHRIEKEQGRLDMLINNAFRIPPGGPAKLFEKFWEQGAETWDTVHTIGLRSHFVATCLAMPLLQKTVSAKTQILPQPFVGMISSFGGLTYTFNVPYGVGKAGVDRMVKDMALELESENICVTSFWPGVVVTERTEALFETGEWQEYVNLPLDLAETPEFTGRAIVEVATDPSSMQKKSGTYQVVAELAKEYDFTDLNGKQPPSIRSLKFLIPTYGITDEEMRKRVPDWMIPDWKLPFWVMASGRPPKKEEEPRPI